MVREIGGYFCLEQLPGVHYHHGLVAINSGRNALRYLLIAKRIRKLHIPYYLCTAVAEVCIHSGCEVEHYGIGQHFEPELDRGMSPGEYMYIVNYFGQLTSGDIMRMQRRFGNVILDNVQAFFAPPLPGIDTIYSCRKFFGVADGAYLSTDAGLPDDLTVDVSMSRMTHLLGRYDGTARDYYQDFLRAEALIERAPLMRMSRITYNLLRAIDYESVCSARDRNFAYLNRELGSRNRLNLIVPDGPYAYPFYVENGRTMRVMLAQKGVYIPTLWPNVLSSVPVDRIEYKYAHDMSHVK